MIDGEWGISTRPPVSGMEKLPESSREGSAMCGGAQKNSRQFLIVQKNLHS
jgi:hypothetical protein